MVAVLVRAFEEYFRFRMLHTWCACALFVYVLILFGVKETLVLTTKLEPGCDLIMVQLTKQIYKLKVEDGLGYTLQHNKVTIKLKT